MAKDFSWETERQPQFRHTRHMEGSGYHQAKIMVPQHMSIQRAHIQDLLRGPEEDKPALSSGYQISCDFSNARHHRRTRSNEIAHIPRFEEAVRVMRVSDRRSLTRGNSLPLPPGVRSRQHAQARMFNSGEHPIPGRSRSSRASGRPSGVRSTASRSAPTTPQRDENMASRMDISASFPSVCFPSKLPEPPVVQSRQVTKPPSKRASTAVTRVEQTACKQHKRTRWYRFLVCYRA